jgi:hypothetical protein
VRLITGADKYARFDFIRPCLHAQAELLVRAGISLDQLPDPDRVVRRPKALVEVSHGRWLVLCPWCTSAQYAQPDDLWWWCVDCRNATVDGKLVAVDWPADADAIETELLRRPHSSMQNAWPGETARQLAKETSAYLDIGTG